VVKVSSFSAAYSDVFAGAFGLAWHRALLERFGGRATNAFAEFGVPNFARGEREAFEVPDVAAAGYGPVDTAADKVPGRGTAEFEAEVAEGRRWEDSEIAVREAFATQVRGCEPAAGCEEPGLSKSLRAQIIDDQWKDAELGTLCLQLRKAPASDPAPGVRRLGGDLALEEYVVVGLGEERWLLVLPETGGPGGSVGWRRFIFLHVTLAPPAATRRWWRRGSARDV